MINSRRTLMGPKRLLRFSLYSAALFVLAAGAACQSGNDSSGASESRGVVVVNAPAAGEVKRVLVREGVAVEAGTPIVEIVVRNEGQVATPSPGESAGARAARNFKAADAEIEAARAEAVRHEAEVQRLTPLVASGEASQAQLDGERALYERAQQRLQQAQETRREAERGLLTARQQEQPQGGTAAPAEREQTVTANASSAGTVSAITVRAGERVKAGQPLATLRTN